MPVLKDEMVLNIDGIFAVDPALGIDERSKAFIASREWTTPSVYYGYQDEPEFSQDTPKWSIALNLGLDHVPTTEADWFADVKAMMEYAHSIAKEVKCEFIVEFRLSSRLWYSETIAFLSFEDKEVDYEAARTMLEHFIGQFGRRSWLQRLFGRR